MVINCSEGVKGDILTSMLKEQNLQNTSVIFDEFNRLSKEAIVEFFKSTATMDKKDVHFIGITYNPFYLGRSDIENTGYEFDHLEFIIPDYKLIATSMLALEGFSDNR